jgi:formylmethanofuran dehydrogenase subunit E
MDMNIQKIADGQLIQNGRKISMSERVDGKVFIYAEKPQQCDACGEIAELRPYGPNGECICFNCAMKDEPTTKKMMGKVLFGEQ